MRNCRKYFPWSCQKWVRVREIIEEISHGVVRNGKVAKETSTVKLDMRKCEKQNRCRGQIFTEERKREVIMNNYDNYDIYEIFMKAF